MSTAPPAMSPHDAAVIMTSHLYLVDTHAEQPMELCSRCRRVWPCPDRYAAEMTLYGRELDR